MHQELRRDSAIAKTIREAARQDALSHALILSGSGDLTTAARYAAAAMLCTDSGERPCMKCAACRKVAEDIHPDVRFVAEDEHKELAVNAIRDLRKDAYIRPNEGRCKVYVFHRCEQLNERDQNVLLKVVEEGPPYAAFIFCAPTSADLLPTIRSRCVIWKMNEAEEATVEAQAVELCRVLAQREILSLTEFAALLESQRLKREQVQRIFRDAWRIAAEALLMLCGKNDVAESVAANALELGRTFSRSELQNLINLLAQYARECDYNIGVGHVWGAFSAQWAELIREE